MLVQVREHRPHAQSGALERDIDRILRDFRSDAGSPACGVNCDVAPDNEGVTIRADVPGVPPSAINVAVDGRTLTISGERTSEKESDGGYQVRERHYGKFSRSFHLSDDLDTAAVEAQCHDGVLSLRIPMRPGTQPRQIEVKTS